MRALTSGERTLLGGSTLGFHGRLYVANASGALIDLSTWVVDWSIDQSIDAPVSSMTLSVKRSDGALSLAPLMAASTLNRDSGGGYAPLLDVARRIQLWTAVTALGVAPVSGDWRQMFEGVIDTVDAGPATIKLACRDLGAVLLDTQIRQSMSYGSPTGTAVETVMTQIINANVLTNPPALVVPVSPNWLITSYLQDTTNVFDAIRALALQIGWEVRYVWSGAAFNLTLYDPGRTKTTPDATIPPTEYLDVNQLAVDRQGIRNIIEIEFSDAANNNQRTTSVFTDSGSVARYGAQYMSIGEAGTSNINTAAEVAVMGAAVLSDLASPPLAQGIETLYWWPAQLGDLYQFTQNGVHYDSDQRLAVIGITHSGQGIGKARTVIKARGKPAGAFAYWLTRAPIGPAGILAGVPEILFVNSPPIAVYDKGTFLGWRLSGAVDSDTAALVIALSPGLTMYASVPNFVPSTGANGGPEYWLDLSGTVKNWTVEVHQPLTSNDEILLQPHALYNPSAAPPRAGAVGEIWDIPLSRAPVTDRDVAYPTSTLREVTLTVSPASSTTKFRLDATSATDPWTSSNLISGSVVIGAGTLTDPFIDVSAKDRLLEYYSVSIDGLVEPVHRLILGTKPVPTGVLTLSEPTAGVLQVDVALEDKVIRWRTWARRNADPYINATDPDPLYFWWEHPKDQQEDRRRADGDGGSTSTWHVVVRFYDSEGQYTEILSTILIQGTLGTGGTGTGSSPTLFNRYAQWSSGLGAISLYWTPSTAITAAAAGKYLIRALVNGIEQEPLSAALSAQVGIWNFPAAIVPASTPGAQRVTYTFVLELYDSAAPATPIGSYTVVYSDWIAGTVQGPGNPPPPLGTAPPTPVVVAGATGSLQATASWAAPLATYQIDIEWYEDTSATFNSQFLFFADTLVAGSRNSTAYNFDALAYARCRTRYRNANGPGPTWSAWSNGVQIPSRGNQF